MKHPKHLKACILPVYYTNNKNIQIQCQASKWQNKEKCNHPNKNPFTVHYSVGATRQCPWCSCSPNGLFLSALGLWWRHKGKAGNQGFCQAAWQIKYKNQGFSTRYSFIPLKHLIEIPRFMPQQNPHFTHFPPQQSIAIINHTETHQTTRAHSLHQQAWCRGIY